MPNLDVFNSDAFNCRSLSAAVNKLPYKPGKLGAMGLFQPKSVATTLIQVEERNGKLSLVQTQDRRGGPSNLSAQPSRKMHPFTIPHLPKNDAVFAEDVQNIRSFGSETELETVSEVVADRQQSMKDDLEVTKEYHRIGAIQGKILDADGSTLVDFFDEFSVTEQTDTWDFSSDDMKERCANTTREIETALGAVPFDYIVGVAGNDFWDRFVATTDVKTAYTAYVQGGSDFLKTQQRANGFWFGDIYWMNYRGQVGSNKFVADTRCQFFPMGVPGMFLEVYAPANYIETVNTMGQPYYSKQSPMKFEKGVELEVQTNVLCLCTRPAALVHATGQA